MSAPCNLKPCAHCGGAAKFDVDGYGNGYVICEACGAQTSGDHSPSGAFEAWNRRTQPEATKPAQDLSAAILALPLPKPFDSGDGNHEDKFTESQFREFRAAAAALASPADALEAGDRVAVKDAVRNALDLYADSYERMNRQNPDCKVSPTDVAYDIRRNMVESTIAAIQAQKDGHG